MNPTNKTLLWKVGRIVGWAVWALFMELGYVCTWAFLQTSHPWYVVAATMPAAIYLSYRSLSRADVNDCTYFDIWAVFTCAAIVEDAVMFWADPSRWWTFFPVFVIVIACLYGVAVAWIESAGVLLRSVLYGRRRRPSTWGRN